jgi:hypothetical protein
VQFYVYKIQNPHLRPFIQYILFNCNRTDKKLDITIRSYANSNVCLGITRDQEMFVDNQEIKQFVQKPGIFSYLSGLYSEPYIFKANGLQDEICIDFTPIGYFHFFKLSLQKYIFNEDILSESFGGDSLFFFENIFEQQDLHIRGQRIEQFFLKKLVNFSCPDLEHIVAEIDLRFGDIKLKDLSATTTISEKKIYRLFSSLLDIALSCGYTDDSHLIKEFKHFTGISPGKIITNIKNIDEEVLVTIY